MSRFQSSSPAASRRARGWFRAFTLVELLLVVGVIAILGGVAVVAVSNSRESGRVSKLENDVATLNAAIQVYLVSGGTLPTGSTTPQQVIDKLKTVASSETAHTVPGLRGSMIDRRLAAEMQSADEAAGSRERALWDATAQRFFVSTGGGVGVKSFWLDDSLAGNAPATEARTPSLKGHSGDWVWNYSDRAPAGTPAAVPDDSGVATDPTGGPTPPPKTTLQLAAPTFSHAAGEHPLVNFDLQVTLANPNPSGTSTIWYSVDGGPLTLYSNAAIPVGPQKTLNAVAISADPDRWTDSPLATSTYNPVPITLEIAINLPQSTITYAAAGGAMSNGTATAPSAGLTLTNAAAIPPAYTTSSRFQSYYTLDNTAAASSGTAVAGPTFSGAFASPAIPISVGAFGTGSTLTVRAVAKPLPGSEGFFNQSPEVSGSVAISPTDLATPIIDPPTGQKAADLPVSILMPTGSAYPVGARIFYTVNGADPGVGTNGEPLTGNLYSGQFNSGAGEAGQVIVRARVYGPAGAGQWFTPSALATATYNTITTPEGALVGSASLDGTFVGSLIYATPTSGPMTSITFNSNAKILNGNLYVPGTPSVRLSNGTTWTAANDSSFATNILGWEFDAAGNKTVQTTPRVIEHTGNINPTNYSITFNNKALLEGKVVRRYNAPAFPTVAPPSPPDSSGSISVNAPRTTPISSSQHSNVNLNSGAGEVRLLGGNYASLNAGSGTSFVLGDPDNPDITQVYSFQQLNLNSGASLKVVGKAIVTVAGNLNLSSGSTLGNSARPDWLQLQFSSGNFTANANSYTYAQLVNPTGSVAFNSGSVFQGSVTARTLTINSQGVVFNLPPVIQN